MEGSRTLFRMYDDACCNDYGFLAHHVWVVLARIDIGCGSMNDRAGGDVVDGDFYVGDDVVLFGFFWFDDDLCLEVLVEQMRRRYYVECPDETHFGIRLLHVLCRRDDDLGLTETICV